MNAAGTTVPADEYYDVDVPVEDLKRGDTVWLGGRLAVVVQVLPPFMGVCTVEFRRPGSIVVNRFRVRDSVRLIQRAGSCNKRDRHHA